MCPTQDGVGIAFDGQVAQGGNARSLPVVDDRQAAQCLAVHQLHRAVDVVLKREYVAWSLRAVDEKAGRFRPMPSGVC
ncbi:hypothetical protein [Streptomyces sp. P9-A2]|uniref:hypothetical protein n=1 Tax=Streptomyces sp. P9-A2 TaxID=3072284 RepID=UPI002FC71B2F